MTVPIKQNAILGAKKEVCLPMMTIANRLPTISNVLLFLFNFRICDIFLSLVYWLLLS